MIGAVRAEVLRAVSAPQTTITLAVLAVFVPAVVLQSGGGLDDLTDASAQAATTRMLQPLAWSFVAAAFVGMYAVTREYYYDSMNRTLVTVGFARAFASKAVGAAVVGVVLTVAVAIVWSIAMAVILGREGIALTPTPVAVRIIAGSVLAAALGALLGAAVGWLVRNYYLGAGLVLGLPMLVELALLRTSPEVARFSPGAALAALGASGQRPELLSFFPALGIVCAWGAVIGAAGWLVARRRTS